MSTPVKNNSSPKPAVAGSGKNSRVGSRSPKSRASQNKSPNSVSKSPSGVKPKNKNKENEDDAKSIADNASTVIPENENGDEIPSMPEPLSEQQPDEEQKEIEEPLVNL